MTFTDPDQFRPHPPAPTLLRQYRLEVERPGGNVILTIDDPGYGEVEAILKLVRKVLEA